VSENLWHVDIEICQFSTSAVGVRFSLIHPSRGHQIWADNKTVEMQGAPPTDHPDLALLSNQLIEAAGDALFLNEGPDENCPDTLCRYAIRTMFEINPKDVEIADQMFDRAYKLEPRGLYLAWRAQAKTIVKIERYGADEHALTEEADELCARALELEPNNSMVLATVANTYCLTMRAYERSLFLASRSTLLNPSNPMAWFALSSASMYAGKSKDALQYTLKANQLALTSPHRFWWDSQVFAAALTSGKLSEAQFFAESCHAQKPDFRPPLRYLIALFSNSGQNDKALQMADRLTELEPDFTIERLIKDREYPAALLHKDIGIDLAKVSDLD
jgi:tetratricopeptide (TPR) repeat protein